MKRIYLSPPHLEGRERELLIEAYESNWITTLGPQVDAFEQEICEKIGIKPTVPDLSKGKGITGSCKLTRSGVIMR